MQETGLDPKFVRANGDNVRYAVIDGSGRSSYVVLNPDASALAAWLNGCDDKGDSLRGPVTRVGGPANNLGIPAGSAFGWAVYIPEPIGLTPAYEDQECGIHFLKVLRKQSGCETPTTWECSTHGKGITLSFDTSIFCGKGQIQKAVWDSINPQIGGDCVKCGNSRDELDSKSAWDIFVLTLGLIPGSPSRTRANDGRGESVCD